MPSKTKEALVAQRKTDKQKEDDKFKNCPPWIKSSPGKISPLAADIMGGTKIFNWKGNRFDAEGNLVTPPPDGKAANKIREDNARKNALLLVEKYGYFFHDTKRTKEIAKIEGKSERTIRRYRHYVLASGQAK